MLSEYFKDGEIRKYIDSKKHDPWAGTIFEGYLKLSNTQMGAVGEILVKKIMRNLGHEIIPRQNQGHDIIIDGYKTEVKFSLTKSHFSFNHLSIKKDWDRVILMGVKGEEDYSLYWFKKEDFIEHINSKENLFNRQQGGVDGDNDDYMITNNFEKLKKTNLLHDISSWLIDDRKKIGIELWLHN